MRRLIGNTAVVTGGAFASLAILWVLLGLLFLFVALSGGEEEGVASPGDAVAVVAFGCGALIVGIALVIAGRRLREQEPG